VYITVLVRRFAGIDPSITSNTVAGVGPYIISIIPLPKWKDLEFEQDRERDEKPNSVTNLRSTYPMQERLHRYKSHPNDSKLTARSYYVSSNGCQKWK
jgi:hypothetical protein